MSSGSTVSDQRHDDMLVVLQNVKTGKISVERTARPMLLPGRVLVQNQCSLVSVGTEKSVLDFSKASYLAKARKRPDLVRKVIRRAKNEGLWETYKVVQNLMDQPIALGYSSAGEVVEVGSEVGDISVGCRVACAGLFTATHSEFVSVPRNLLVPVPENVSYEEASFVTLGAIALQGVRLAQLELGETVLVYGLGLVGMMSALIAGAAGCRVLGIDVDQRKLDRLEAYGHTPITNQGSAEKIASLTSDYGVDKVLVCAGTKSNEPIERIPGLTRQKGIVVIVGDVGMNIPRRDYFEKEIDIRISRSYGPGRYDPSYEEGGIDYPFGYVRWTENRNMQAIVDLLAQKRIDMSGLITHRYEIAQAEQAYKMIESPQEEYLGITISYPALERQAKTRQLPATLPEGSRSNTSERIGFGIIGAGQFAKGLLLPAFASSPSVSFEAICTASGVSASGPAKRYDIAQQVSDPAELLENPRVNAIIVATRHDSHASYVISALEKNLAVYVEKPLTTNLEDLDAVAEAYRHAAQGGQPPFLMVGFNRRFSPLAQLVKTAFADVARPLSVVYRVNAGYVPKSEWVHDPVAGGGRVIGEVGHFIDFISFITGAQVVSVSAASPKRKSDIVGDSVHVTLEFDDGSIGAIHYGSTGNSGMPKEYVEVSGGGKSAILDNFRRVRLYGARAPGKRRYMNQVKGFKEEAQAFIERLQRGEGAPIPFESLYNTTLATLLIHRACTSGNRLPVGGLG